MVKAMTLIIRQSHNDHNHIEATPKNAGKYSYEYVNKVTKTNKKYKTTKQQQNLRIFLGTTYIFINY